MDITPERKMIQQEETQPQAAVTESVMSRVGAGINYINTRHVYQHDWNINGRANRMVIPFLGVDGIITYKFDFKIEDVMLIVGNQNGFSGQSELDIKWRPENTGVWTSIFTTTPKFTYQALPFDAVRLGLTVPNMTTPVLNKTDFDAHDQLRLDVLTTVGGPIFGTYMKIWIRPR